MSEVPIKHRNAASTEPSAWSEEERIAYIKSKRGFDRSKIRIGATVFHIRLGEGTLTEINVPRRRLIAVFPSGRFSFSLDSFEKGFLHLK